METKSNTWCEVLRKSFLGDSPKRSPNPAPQVFIATHQLVRELWKPGHLGYCFNPPTHLWAWLAEHNCKFHTRKWPPDWLDPQILQLNGDKNACMETQHNLQLSIIHVRFHWNRSSSQEQHLVSSVEFTGDGERNVPFVANKVAASASLLRAITYTPDLLSMAAILMCRTFQSVPNQRNNACIHDQWWLSKTIRANPSPSLQL